eukprot:TRINITY_DN17047_c0_g1_i3.p1 TRINITY_DN17047_c0_g1~~TRINITY_DN17047_c0_g1_i3.p1  ORF type:complete len:1325 (+),score=391.49 TRINITY_DN17047_c0_g1_i3:58-4032(+)
MRLEDDGKEQQNAAGEDKENQPPAVNDEKEVQKPTVLATERKSVRRLMIMKMQLINFKSYAGENTIGPFHKKFSAILGPNGSGKSNVIDAMLFVFGRKAKQIRLNKIGSLVHKSDAHPNLKTGKVSVYFQEIIDYEDSDDAFDPVAGTELTVSRSCTTEGTSHYYVNNKKVSYREVIALLKDKGIDLDHNRFLILQGEVEQISLMKPKAPNDNEDGLLEYIEDIIGTQHYKSIIDSGTEKVEKLTEERETHVNRVASAEKDREALEGAKREAEEYLRLEVKISKERAIYIQLRLQTLLGELDKKKAEVESLQQKLEEEGEKSADTKQELQQLESDSKKEKKKCDQLIKHFEKAQAEYRKLDTNSAEHQTNLKHATATYERLKTAQKKAVAEVTKTEKQIALAEEQLAENTKELTQLQKVLESEEEDCDRQTEALQEKLKPLREQYERMQLAIQPFNEEVSKAEEALKSAESEKKLVSTADDTITLKLKEEQRRLAERGTRITRLEDDLKNNKKDLKDRITSLESDQQKLKTAEKALPEVRSREKELLASVESLKKQAQDAGSENAVQRALKRLKQQGGLDGYYGRLGDLGAIDSRFGVAISTAAGAQLNTLVVDNEATGKRILQYLKENNTGRATVILLDLQHQQFHKIINSEFKDGHGLQRLFDLIRPVHEKFAPAFYFAVRDTLVAPDMDKATEIAYQKGLKQKPRVVTLNGELIEVSGTMTGGGKQVTGGGMKSFQVSPTLREDLVKQQKALEQASADDRQLSNTIASLKDRVFTATAKVKELQSIIRSKEHELSHLHNEVANIEKALEALQQESHAAEQNRRKEAAKIAELEKRCETCSKALDQARYKRKDQDDQIELIKMEMQKVGGSKYIKLQESIKHKKARVEELEKANAESSATATSCKKNLAAKRKKAESTEVDATKAKEKLESLKSEDIEEDDRITELKEQLANIKHDVEQAKKAVDKIEKAKDARKLSLNKLKAAEVKVEHAFKAASNELQACTSQKKKLKETLQGIDSAIQKSIIDYGVEILEKGEVEDPTSFNPLKFTAQVDTSTLEEYDATHVKRNIQIYEETQRKLKPNIKALEEYQQKHKILMERSEELSRVSDARTAAQQEVDGLRKARHDEFMVGFSKITLKLKEMYQMLTLGGDAELELVDSYDPFVEGIQFSVRPPKKSWKHISNLSGGEKTLSSLALVFALHHFKPTPFYVMDEIDAALDFKNVSIVGNYVKSAASNAQFIIISLRDHMFDLANRLIGISKVNNCTQTAALNPGSYPISIEMASLQTEPGVEVTQPITPAPVKRARDDSAKPIKIQKAVEVTE